MKSPPYTIPTNDPVGTSPQGDAEEVIFNKNSCAHTPNERKVNRIHLIDIFFLAKKSATMPVSNLVKVEDSAYVDNNFVDKVGASNWTSRLVSDPILAINISRGPSDNKIDTARI